MSRLNQVQISIREFDPTNWILSEPVEILVEKKGNLEDLIENILKRFPHIKVKQFCKKLERKFVSTQISFDI